MKRKQSVIEIFREYEKYNDELNKATNAENEAALSDRYRALRDECVSFCRSEGFLSIMQILCRLNGDKLNFSPKDCRIAFLGKTPAPMSFDYTNCFEVKDKAKNMMLAIRSGSPKDEAAIQSLCVGYVTLVAIANAAKQMYITALGVYKKNNDERVESLKESIAEKVGELKRFASAEVTPDDGIYIGSHSIAADKRTAKRLADILGTDGALPEEKIVLRAKEGESSLFVHIDDSRKGTAAFNDFVNGVFYRNFRKFCVGELSVACIEDNSLSSLPLSQMHSHFLVHDKAEVNLVSFSYGNVAQNDDSAAKMLQSIVDEMNVRKPLMGASSSCDGINDYNLKNPYNKKANILLLMNGYSSLLTTERAYKNLCAILKDGGRYGIFAIVMGQIDAITLQNGTESLLDLDELGVSEISFGDEGLELVSADCATVDAIRREARGSMKQNEILYLDELLDQKPQISYFGKEITIPVGLCGGKIYYFATSVDRSMSEYGASPFTLIIGSTGMGKSAFLHTLILGGAMCYSPDELQFYIVDFKSKDDSAEFSCYLHKKGVDNLYIPHVRYISMKSTAENAYDVLDMIENLNDERLALFSSVGAKDFIAYNTNEAIQERVKNGELPHVPQIYFLIDEYITMLGGGVGGNDEARAEIENKFSDILQRIRTSGVGLIFSGQRSVFKNATMGLIGNRIAFDPGNESLLNAMFSFDYSAGEDGTELYRSISGKVGIAAAARSSTASHKEVVRTAFAGKHMGERQRALAKAIREKYSDPRYYGKQIVPGKDEMENGDTFLKDFCSLPIPKKEIERQSREKELRIPLYLGISAMTSKPVALRYYLNKTPTGGALILAKAPKQERIEMNLALTMLHYIVVNGNTPRRPVVILNDLSAQEQLTDVFGNVIEGSSARHLLVEALENHGLGGLCELNNSAIEVSTAIMNAEQLWNDRMRGACTDRTPILLVLHDAGELCSLKRYLELEYDSVAEEEAQAEEVKVEETAIEGGDEQVDLAALMGGSDMSDDMMLALGNVEDPEVNVDDVSVSEVRRAQTDGRRYTEGEVLSALRHLVREGNRQNVFVVFGCGDASAVERLLGINWMRKEDKAMFSGIFYGSDTVRKTLDVSKDENLECCFSVPQELKTRLYDFSDSAEGFWENLKKYY